MKKNKKIVSMKLIVLTFILMSAVAALVFADRSYGTAIRNIQYANGQYYSIDTGLYTMIPEKSNVIEQGATIIIQAPEGEIRIEKENTSALTAEDFLTEYTEKHNLTMQIISSPLKMYITSYINGRRSSTEKGYTRMIDTDTAVLITTDNPNLYPILEQVAENLKYIKKD